MTLFSLSLEYKFRFFYYNKVNILVPSAIEKSREEGKDIAVIGSK